MILQVILEDSNGEKKLLWKYDAISEEQLKELFVGATGGLYQKSDNSALAADEKGIYELQKKETYVVVVPPKSQQGILSNYFFFTFLFTDRKIWKNVACIQLCLTFSKSTLYESRKRDTKNSLLLPEEQK